MNTKFIDLSLVLIGKSAEKKLLINPFFIESIQEIDLNEWPSVSKSIVSTIGGKDHYVTETVEQIKDKIKDSEKFIMFKENPNFSL